MKQNSNVHMVYAAKFNSEQYWQPENVAMLPAIRDRNLENIVDAMDELMFCLCTKKEDIVLTGKPMDKAHLLYLKELGFEFTNRTYPSDSNEDAVLQCQLELPENALMETYAVIPEYDRFAEGRHLTYLHPDMEIVKKVNSKIYSTELSQKLGYSQYAQVVRSEEEFTEAGKRILEQGNSIIIKEEYGVSGKGNLKITDEKKFASICKNVSMQCKKGREVRFIIEPAFEVKKDFSVQYYIDEKTGKAEWLSIQQILNQERAYHGSVTADEELLSFLKEHQYFEVMEQVMSRLYQDGYYGDVCVDSMIVEDDMLVPIVEINARKSMSLIKKSLEERLAALDYKKQETCTFYVDTVVYPELTVEEVFRRIRDAKILFTRESGKGVLPLTSNTLLVNIKKGVEKTQKGRMYFLLAGSREEIADYRNQITKLCKSFAERQG